MYIRSNNCFFNNKEKIQNIVIVRNGVTCESNGKIRGEKIMKKHV